MLILFSVHLRCFGHSSVFDSPAKSLDGGHAATIVRNDQGNCVHEEHQDARA